MIYTCYAGVGKTTLAEKNEKVIDLDSTLFRLGFRGDFLKDWYIIYTQVAENLSKQGFDVFIGTHEIVRDELKRKEIPFIPIFPALELKEVWIEKLKQRYENTHFSKDKRAYLYALNEYDKSISALMKEKDARIITDMDYVLEEML